MSRNMEGLVIECSKWGGEEEVSDFFDEFTVGSEDAPSIVERGALNNDVLPQRRRQAILIHK